MKTLALFLIHQAPLLERHPLLTLLAFAVILRILLIPARAWTAARRAVRPMAALLPWAAIAVLAGYAGCELAYLLREGLYDPTEPAVASLTAGFLRGLPIYHGMEAPECYSLAYGPLLVMVHAVFFKVLGSSIAAAKAGGMIASLLALGVLAWAVSRELSLRTGWVVAALLALVALSFRNYSWWNRPEPFLLLLAAASALAVRRAPTWTAVAVLAGSLAAAVNLKAYGPLHLIPFVLLLQERAGWRVVAGTAALAACLALAPWLLLPQGSLGLHFQWVSAIGRHGVTPGGVLANLEFLLLIFLPLAPWLIPPASAAPGLRRYALACAAVVGASLVFASKTGSGAYQFLPILPAIALLYCRVRIEAPRPIRSLLRRPRLALVSALTVTLALNAAASQSAFHWSMLVRERGVAADFDAALAKAGAREVAVGCSDARTIDRTYYRHRAIAAGHPLVFDVQAAMDLEQAGVSWSTAAIPGLVQGRVPVWILPDGGTPFSAESFYGEGRPVFPPAFRDAFLRHYRPGERTKYFVLWVHESVR